MSTQPNVAQSRTSTLARLKALARLLACSAILLLVACGPAADSSPDSSQIPVPPSAQDPELVKFPDGQIQLSFTDEQHVYPDSEIRNFYARWADENGWHKIPSDVEPWSVDQWQSFEDAQGADIHQLLVHWQSPDGTESLRLAIRQVGDRDQEQVYVIRSPFQLLTGEANANQGAAPSQGGAPCAQDHLSDPVARYQPLPHGGTLADHCPEPLVDPSVTFTINREGRIESVSFVRGSGCSYADDELRRCLAVWQFDPATCEGQPVEVERGLAVGWDDLKPPSTAPDPCRPLEADSSPR